MVVYRTLRELRRESVIAIGNFDGFHLGHRRIVQRLLTHARRRKLLSVIISFFPHPRHFLGHDIALIFTDGQKKQVLLSQPVDRFFLLDFADIRDIPAASFIEETLVGRLHMKALAFSGDFLFGSGRTGDVELLKSLAGRLGLELLEVAPVIVAGERVSSSAIRKKLLHGDIAAANRMLGSPYAIEGVVERGEGIGRRIGFPTLNIRTANRLLPPGVFQTRVEVGGVCHPAVTNIGSRPTFGGGAVRVETHIPGFDRSMYGRKIRLFFLRRIRVEIRFENEEQLTRQIAADIATSKKRVQ